MFPSPPFCDPVEFPTQFASHTDSVHRPYADVSCLLAPNRKLLFHTLFGNGVCGSIFYFLKKQKLYFYVFNAFYAQKCIKQTSVRSRRNLNDRKCRIRNLHGKTLRFKRIGRKPSDDAICRSGPRLSPMI